MGLFSSRKEKYGENKVNINGTDIERFQEAYGFANERLGELEGDEGAKTDFEREEIGRGFMKETLRDSHGMDDRKIKKLFEEADKEDY